MNKLVVAVVIVLASRAYADTDTTYHLDGGVEFEGGHDVSSTAFRGHALVGNSFGSGRVRPQLAAGLTFGGGSLYVDDPRAVDSAVGVNFWSVGPELQLGMQVYRNGDASWRLFASLAYMHVGLDSRLMIDPLPGVGGDHGERAALGINVARAAMREAREQHCAPKVCDPGFLAVLMPQQLELTTEHDAGSQRYGVAFSWGS